MLSESAIALPLRLVEKLVASSFVRKGWILCRIVQDIDIFVAGAGCFHVENDRPRRVTVVIVDEPERCMFYSRPIPVRAKVVQTAERLRDSFIAIFVVLFYIIKDCATRGSALSCSVSRKNRISALKSMRAF